ncbi:MAG: hypothetical protein ACREXN_13290 [Polaromonas sp.]
MKTTVKPLRMMGLVALLALSALWGGAAQAAHPYVSATVEGALTPGVYGRIDIGTAPPPPLIYAQPIIIQRPPVLVQQPPLYLHVPPGHAKKWSKHCAKYNACGQPVYFVKVRGDDDYDDDGHKWRKDKDKHHGHGKKHGKGHDRDDD